MRNLSKYIVNIILHIPKIQNHGSDSPSDIDNIKEEKYLII